MVLPSKNLADDHRRDPYGSPPTSLKTHHRLASDYEVLPIAVQCGSIATSRATSVGNQNLEAPPSKISRLLSKNPGSTICRHLSKALGRFSSGIKREDHDLPITRCSLFFLFFVFLSGCRRWLSDLAITQPYGCRRSGHPH